MLKYISRDQTKQKPQVTVSHFGQLPNIPWPSSNLQSLLNKYDYDTKKNQNQIAINLRKRALTTPKKKKINGFTAFRSFYTKSILGVQSQKKLSSELAGIWKTEPFHNIWNTYALIYNATGGNESFVDWLIKNIGFIGENAVEHQAVEDIIWEGEDFKVIRSQSFLY